jgi:uncharacterized protein
MVPAPRWLLVPVVLIGWLGLAGPVPAAVYPPPIKDEGRFFSAEALDKANKKVREIYAHTGKDLVIETVAAIPEDLKKKYEELGKDRFFSDWARRRAEDLGARGIYVLICRSPGRVEVVMDKQTARKAFTEGDRDKMVKKVLDKFREKQFDAGLLEGVDFVASTLKAAGGK